jgi:hypothetical protein
VLTFFWLCFTVPQSPVFMSRRLVDAVPFGQAPTRSDYEEPEYCTSCVPTTITLLRRCITGTCDYASIESSDGPSFVHNVRAQCHSCTMSFVHNVIRAQCPSTLATAAADQPR